MEGSLTTSKTDEENYAILELFLSNITTSDEGTYKCDASNEYQTVSTEVKVNVMSDKPYEYKHEYEKLSERNFTCFPQVHICYISLIITSCLNHFIERIPTFKFQLFYSVLMTHWSGNGSSMVSL